MGRFKSKVGPSSIPPSPSHPPNAHHFPAVTRAPGQSTVRNSVFVRQNPKSTVEKSLLLYFGINFILT